MAKFNVENKRAEINLIKPSLIKLPAFTGRWKRNAEDITKRKEDLLRDGQLQPVGVRKLEDGTPELVFGFTRHAAGLLIEQNDNPEFMLMVVTLSADDVKAYAILNIRENIDRTDLSDVDLAFDQQELRETHGMKNKEIAEVFRCDPAKVTRLSKLLKLSESVKGAVHSGNLATAAAIEMVDLPHDEQDVCLQRGVTKLTDVVEYVRKWKQPAAPVAAPVAPVAAPVVATNAEGQPAELPTTTTDATAPAAPVAQPATTTDAPALDFGKIGGDAAPVKPNAQNRQRTVQQVKTVLGYYVTEDTHLVLRTFAASMLAYVSGDIGEIELENIIRTIEGNPERPANKPKA